MHSLTSDGRRYQLRVEMTRGDGRKYYEVYDDFSIGPRNTFVLHIGQERGNAGNHLIHFIHFLPLEDIMSSQCWAIL